MRRCFAVLSASTFCLLVNTAGAQEVSENSYFEDLPVVLSVTRLAQPLDETPGAVTIIDADTIRRSGARDVAELLRLVPGFLFSRRYGANPVATYHSALDTYGARVQVFVDGHSMYTPYFLGGTQWGMLGVVLEDIQRIEVLRGSNSAAYGSNAFLGVVNIITRHTADTHGGMVSVSAGEKGIKQNVVRVGGGNDVASVRITASRRNDDGLDNVYDDMRLSQLHLRTDLRPSPSDELRFHLGSVTHAFGEGAPPSSCNASFIGKQPGTCDGSPIRTNEWRRAYAFGHWTHTLGADESFTLSAHHETERYTDYAIASQRATLVGFATVATAVLDVSGTSSRQSIEAQHTKRFNEYWRVAWGGELRREENQSVAVYGNPDSVSAHQARLFANVEWRPGRNWLVNAGGTVEQHNIIGHLFAPRLMVNYHLTPDHTVRAGASIAQRAPGLLELRAKHDLTVKYSGIVLNPVVAAYLKSTGKAQEEIMITNEVGYLGKIREIGLNIDFRGFVERMNDRLTKSAALDFVNSPGPRIRGFEYQFDWRPLADTRLVLSEAHLREDKGSYSDETLETPRRTASVAWFQKLPLNFDFSLISYTATPYKWTGLLPTSRQLDGRVAWNGRFEGQRIEFALTTQGLNGGHAELAPEYRFTRRTFATLRIDF
jgi:iron complex outermembrane receptor protein